MDTAVMAQIVVEPPVSLIRAFLVELFELFSKPLILCGPLAHYTQSFPFSIVSTTSFLNSGVYFLFGTLFGITKHPTC